MNRTLLAVRTDQWGTMTHEQASSPITRSLAVDQQIAQPRVKYMPIFGKAVPGKVVATFFQLDRRVQALIDIQRVTDSHRSSTRVCLDSQNALLNIVGAIGTHCHINEFQLPKALIQEGEET